jgi:hypothetical protein
MTIPGQERKYATSCQFSVDGDVGLPQRRLELLNSPIAHHLLTSMATVPGSVLCSSLSAYVVTFPSAPRLASYLVEQGLAEQREETDEFLWKQEGGIRWDHRFEDAMFVHLEGRHPWLGRKAFKSLFAYARSLCWHDGLNA